MTARARGGLRRAAPRGGRRAALAGLLALLAAPPAGAEPAVYRFDPAHTFVHFEVLHFGTSTLRGRFGPIEGFVRLDREARRGELSLRIPTAGVATGLAVFDARLREDDLLASQAHPEAYFVAQRFRFDGDRLAEVRGEFTLRGVSEPLSLVARQFACRTDARRDPARAREVCGGEFEGEFRRGVFGATFGLPLIADLVQLRVQVEAVRD